MSKLFKVIALVVAASFMFLGVPYAEFIDDQVEIGVGGTIAGVIDFSVAVRNILDNAVALAGVGFDLVNHPPTPTAPWVVSEQYVNINCRGNYGEWGVYLITDNNNGDPVNLGGNYAGMAPKPLATGPDGLWGTADDINSYSGLIDTATMDNPDNRAAFAWRIEQTWLGADAKPTIVDDDGDATADPNEPTASSAENYKADWKYIVDYSNTGLDTTYVRYLNNNGTPGDPNDDFYVYNYAYDIFGFADGSAIMSQKSDLSMAALVDSDSTWTIPGPSGDTRLDAGLYLAARYGGATPGTYGTRLFVRLVHE